MSETQMSHQSSLVVQNGYTRQAKSHHISARVALVGCGSKQTTQAFRVCSLMLGISLLLFARPVLAAALISSVTTDSSRYAPGAVATISANLTNNTGKETRGVATVYITHLGSLCAILEPKTFSLASGASRTLAFTWPTPKADFQGYSVEVWTVSSGRPTAEVMTSAIDVSSSWTKFPRYGYVSTYPSQNRAVSSGEIAQLNNFHINGIQFYDWQWKHHVPLAGTPSSPATSWVQLDNLTNYRQTVLDYINAAHAHGMSAMEYNLLYGAWAGYGQDGSGVNSQWGLFTAQDGTNQYALTMPSSWATPYIFLFDPGNPDWESYILGREADVFSAYPFDGWHVDEVGNPPSNVYTYSGNQVTVWQEFRPFLNAAKQSLNKTIVFNNVGGYGEYDVLANSTEDFAYIECWPFLGQTTYNDLKTTIDDALSWSNGKGVVLPAYMDYTYAQNNTGTFNPPGVLLTDATIFASGASHLELGDGNHMLDNEYFPNHQLLPSSALLQAVQKYYDFDVEYENLLRGGLTNNGNPISMNVASSNDASANTVWAFAKNDDNTHMLNFINLIGESNNDWRDDNANYPEPTAQSNIAVKYYYSGGRIRHLSWASPDSDGGRLKEICFKTGKDDGGLYISFTLPSLAYWDMVYIDLAGNGSAIPAAPIGLSAVSGNAQATLSWSASTGATTYNLYRSTTSGGEGATPYKTGISSTSYTDTGLTNGTAYYYTVAAVNSAGTSPQSSEVEATPSVGPPVGRRIAIVSNLNGNYVTVNTSNGGTLTATSSSVGTPQLFDVASEGGNQFALQAVANSLYVSNNLGGSDTLMAGFATSVGSWETFTWSDLGSGNFGMLSDANAFYVSDNASNSYTLQAEFATNIGAWETFHWVDEGPTP